jgi:hypothetical protein
MASKYKLTGCAKFFFFFIVAAPLAYIGASYYNGQDPIQQAKDFFNFGDKEKTETTGSNDSENITPSNGEVSGELQLKESEIKYLQTKLDNCKEESDKQEMLIETLNKEVTRLKQKAQE